MKKIFFIFIILFFSNTVSAKSCPNNIEGIDGYTVVGANKKEYCMSADMMNIVNAANWCKSLSLKLPTPQELCGVNVHSLDASCKGTKKNPSFAPATFKNGKEMLPLLSVWMNLAFRSGLGYTTMAAEGYIYDSSDYAYALCE